MPECDMPRDERPICQFCGASIPPINGEGTCPKCNPAQIGVDPITLAERAALGAMMTGISILPEIEARKAATEDYRRACTRAVPKYEAALKESERSCDLYKAMKEGVAIRIHDLEGTLQIHDADYRSACEDRSALMEKVARLLRGDFTPEELQGLCHNLSETDYKVFCDGCDAYQKKLFGKCRTNDQHRMDWFELRTVYANRELKLKALADEMESEARRVDHSGSPLSNAPLILEYAERLKQILSGAKPNASNV